MIYSFVEWLRSTIGPWINLIIENYPYIIVLLIILVWLIAAFIVIRKKNYSTKPKKKQRKNPAPAGGYTNFKGEVWYPDGRRWNQDTQKWESADYTEEPTEQN